MLPGGRHPPYPLFGFWPLTLAQRDFVENKPTTSGSPGLEGLDPGEINKVAFVVVYAAKDAVTKGEDISGSNAK